MAAPTIAAGFPKVSAARASQAVSPSYDVAAGQMVLAFVASSSGGSGSNVLSNLTINSGGTLNWTSLIKQNGLGAGPSYGFENCEIFLGTANGPLTGVTTKVYTATSSSYLAIVVLNGAAPTIGGMSGLSGTGNAGGAHTQLYAVNAPSLIIGVGYVQTLTARVADANSTFLDQSTDGQGATMWLEQITNPTSAAGNYTVGTTGNPTGNTWTMAAVEIQPSFAHGTVQLLGTASLAAVALTGLRRGAVTLTGVSAAFPSASRVKVATTQVKRPDVDDPRWAETLSLVRSGIIQPPPSGRLDSGWVDGDQPPAAWENWWKYSVWKWIQWIKSLGSIPTHGVLFSCTIPAAVGRYTVWPGANNENVPATVAAGQTGARRGIMIQKGSYIDSLFAYMDVTTPISSGSVTVEVWLHDVSNTLIGSWIFAPGVHASNTHLKIQKAITDAVAAGLGAYIAVEASVTSTLPQPSNLQVSVRVTGIDSVPTA